MNSCSKSEVRRCRPLLGTFVEIKASGLDDNTLARAVEKAFAQIERIQSLMSVHDDASELSRVNAKALLRPVKISDETFAVLGCGLDIARASNGAFDFTIAPILASWGLLPAHLRRRAEGSWRDVLLQRRQCVRFARPLAIDLGGIAKGFAVDTAITSLRASKVTSASVNAGGDLRVFGPDPSRIHLRHPVSGQPVSNPISLHNAALATSSPCFTRRQWHGRTVSHLLNPRNHRAITTDISISVRARECWLADALTKVVLNADTATVTHLLEAHQAEVLIISA
jgi:thiamine biosynthesis lipoprotein